MALKPPVWTWEVPAYFAVGGIAGTAGIIAGVGDLFRVDPLLVRDATWVAFAGAAISPLLLISDLGRPERFHHMLRVFKPQSAMSMGVWTLVVFSAAITALIALWLFAPASTTLRGIRAALDVTVAVLGGILATYTGVLLGATSIPIWAQHARWLPVHFGASSLGAGAAIIELIGHRVAALNAVAIVAATVETIVLVRFGTPSTRLAGVGNMLSGPAALATRLLAIVLPMARIAAGIAAVAGAVCTRFGWLEAGRRIDRGTRDY